MELARSFTHPLISYVELYVACRRSFSKQTREQGDEKEKTKRHISNRAEAETIRENEGRREKMQTRIPVITPSSAPQRSPTYQSRPINGQKNEPIRHFNVGNISIGRSVNGSG